MAASDITLFQDGRTVKMHPYLVAIVRWCVSYVWSTATVILHRLMSAPIPLPPITASKPQKSRPAGKEHIDPVPKVECVVLHQPEVHNLDVIFVHGLYGSLGNTWRQGEWREKYKEGPEKIELKRPTSNPLLQTCNKCTNHIIYSDNLEINENNNETNINESNFNKTDNRYNDNFRINNEFNDSNFQEHEKNENEEKFFDDIKKIIPEDNTFIEEKFYKNTLLNHVEVISNYESQARFVSELFLNNCDSYCDSNEKTNENDSLQDDVIICKCKENETVINVVNDINECNETDVNECICKVNEKKCEIGCGCVCDDCYSPCWPRDWLKVDCPDARIISINYTSDPHLWRPLWIKESKRLCLYERAEQMTRQLLDLGVGQRPVIWVGHSKGGLFIKQIYCEAYKAHLKSTKDEQNLTEYTKDNEINNLNENNNVISTSNENNNENNNIALENGNIVNNNKSVNEVNGNSFNDNDFKEDNEKAESCEEINVNETEMSSDRKESTPIPSGDRATLWSNSVGFMFYSVPHRGSHLADFKTPLTARSVELLEISKNCSPLLSLQARWLEASGAARPAPLVRSLVETRRTLMSVLRFMIVSPDSADPGIGALCGVSVDHREICKPSSRQCLLYKELAQLIQAAINKCKCSEV